MGCEMALWVEVTGWHQRTGTRPIGWARSIPVPPCPDTHTLTRGSIVAQARKGTCWGHTVILITKSPVPNHTLSFLAGPRLAALSPLVTLELEVG